MLTKTLRILNKIRPLVVVMVLMLFGGPSARADLLSDAVERYEGYLMSKLAQVKRQNPTKTPFVSDGCSGGMSDAWRTLSDTLPYFKEKYGDTPPWEYCCVEHDKAYWRGETENGYAKRKQADEQLRQCVIATGRKLGPVAVVDAGASQQEIEEDFALAADLMYAAVRVGGQPCSIFPWRWGYGWPMCPILDDDLSLN